MSQEVSHAVDCRRRQLRFQRVTLIILLLVGMGSLGNIWFRHYRHMELVYSIEKNGGTYVEGGLDEMNRIGRFDLSLRWHTGGRIGLPTGLLTTRRLVETQVLLKGPAFDDAWLHRFESRLCGLKRLSLHLVSCKFTDDGLLSSGVLQNLTSFYVDDCGLSGACLRSMRESPHLHTLGLHDRTIEVAHVNALGVMPRLGRFSFSKMELGAEGRDWLQRQPKLYGLALKGPSVTDELIVALNHCPKLVTISIADASNITVSQLANLKKIRSLALQGSKITDSSVNSFLQLKQFESLSVAASNLSDEAMALIRTSGIPIQRLPDDGTFLGY